MNSWWMTVKVGEEHRLDLVRERTRERLLRPDARVMPAGIWYPAVAVVMAAIFTAAIIAWRVLN